MNEGKIKRTHNSYPIEVQCITPLQAQSLLRSMGKTVSWFKDYCMLSTAGETYLPSGDALTFECEFGWYIRFTN